MEYLTGKQVALMFHQASQQILEKVDYLNQLDSETGDGDHGTTMQRAMHAAENALQQNASAEAPELFQKIGWEIMCQDGGSAGMLFGNFLIGIGEALGFEDINTVCFAKAFAQGVDRLMQNSGAKPGDKTMVDALVAASDAMSQQAGQSQQFKAVLSAAAQGAQIGADATRDMKPTRGRAKHMGERAIGHLDPGACSMAIFIDGFYRAFL